MIRTIILAATLALAGCSGTSADVAVTTPDGVSFTANLADYKDRESIEVMVERDPGTGRITAFRLQSTNSLTSPVAQIQAAALAEAVDVVSRLAALASPAP